VATVRWYAMKLVQGEFIAGPLFRFLRDRLEVKNDRNLFERIISAGSGQRPFQRACSLLLMVRCARMHRVRSLKRYGELVITSSGLTFLPRHSANSRFACL
jgi:hypothetical protein